MARLRSGGQRGAQGSDVNRISTRDAGLVLISSIPEAKIRACEVMAEIAGLSQGGGVRMCSGSIILAWTSSESHPGHCPSGPSPPNSSRGRSPAYERPSAACISLLCPPGCGTEHWVTMFSQAIRSLTPAFVCTVCVCSRSPIVGDMCKLRGAS